MGISFGLAVYTLELKLEDVRFWVMDSALEWNNFFIFFLFKLRSFHSFFNLEEFRFLYDSNSDRSGLFIYTIFFRLCSSDLERLTLLLLFRFNDIQLNKIFGILCCMNLVLRLLKELLAFPILSFYNSYTSFSRFLCL